jgi:NAD(P)-dependent dehydrogenase (short-subunit alcohol dehydrogenase family)
MSAERYLEGRVAIVTGAARNLGRGFAEMLARHGARVTVHYHGESSRADAEDTARLVIAAGGEAELLAADLTDPSAVERITTDTLRRFGRLDVLVNNAGVIIKKPFAEISDQDFERAFAVNARAPFLLLRAAASHMNDGGRIVNIATSILGCSFPFYSVYAASKASLEHYGRGLAKELGPRHITVNTVAPGALDTPFFYAAETEESVNAIRQFTGGLGAVDDVVPTVEFLVSPGARWFSGQTLFVNGGFVAR